MEVCFFEVDRGREGVVPPHSSQKSRGGRWRDILLVDIEGIGEGPSLLLGSFLKGIRVEEESSLLHVKIKGNGSGREVLVSEGGGDFVSKLRGNGGGLVLLVKFNGSVEVGIPHKRMLKKKSVLVLSQN